MMTVLKNAAIAVLVYMAIVATFESLLGFLQPAGGSTLVITTFDKDGTPHDRVVSRLESDGHDYVAANHWPPAGYRRALPNPEGQAPIRGHEADYRAARDRG